MKNPYSKKPPSSFWKNEITNNNYSNLDIDNYKINFDAYAKIAGYGSCFAQHFIKACRKHFSNKFLDLELSPRELDPDLKEQYGFTQFSTRTGNIYTSSHLLQELNFARNQDGDWTEKCIFKKDERYFDGYRPNIWPIGVKNVDIIISDRKNHAAQFFASVEKCDLFVFTFGLIENWIDKETGYILPLVPGVKFGSFESDKYKWSAERFSVCESNIQKIIDACREINNKIEFLFTVSPVPLIATYSENNVLIANTISKSTIRVAVEQSIIKNKNVKYFPSYELITNPASRQMLFEPNLRSVSDEGVRLVMSKLFEGKKIEAPNGELICDEELIVDET